MQRNPTAGVRLHIGCRTESAFNKEEESIIFPQKLSIIFFLAPHVFFLYYCMERNLKK